MALEQIQDCVEILGALAGAGLTAEIGDTIRIFSTFTTHVFWMYWVAAMRMTLAMSEQGIEQSKPPVWLIFDLEEEYERHLCDFRKRWLFDERNPLWIVELRSIGLILLITLASFLIFLGW